MSPTARSPMEMPSPQGVDSAVGVPKINWYVAVVKNNSEKAASEKLLKMGYECYVPVQSEKRMWKNGRKVVIDRVVIPSILFVKCSESTRKEIVRCPFILRFMTNPAGNSLKSGNKPLAVVPDDQIRKLKFMVGNSDTPVIFGSGSYKKGDWVRIIRGNLAGLEGEVNMIDDKHSEVIVDLNCLGNARLTIETSSIEHINR